MTFLANPLRLKPDDVVKYVYGLNRAKLTWRPKGVTWHNAGAPNLKQWTAYSESTKEVWGRNYNFYCDVTQHWHSGPHGMGTPNGWAYILCDLLSDGVHCSCTNHDHFGEETVGDFSPGVDDPLSGPGLEAMLSSANTIAAICGWLDFDPATSINFHRMCTQDHHACPGSLVKDDWAIGLVKTRLAEIKAAGPNVVTATAPAVVASKPDAAAVIAPADRGRFIQAFLNAHDDADLKIDGVIGDATEAKLVQYLSKQGETNGEVS